MANSRRPGAEAPPARGGWGDVLCDAFYSAGIGGSIVALLFLLVDALEGQPFFTPTLVASVLFLDMPAGQVRETRLDLVAYYTLVHFAGCGISGLIVALAVRRAELRSRHPLLLLLATFLALQLAFYAGASWLAPGVLERVGTGRVTAVNLLAAIGVAAFLLVEHRPRAPRWFRRLGTTST